MLVAQSHANVKIVGSYSGLLIGAVGKTHLDVQDLAIMRAMPDITVLSPADEAELISMMDWAQAYDGPVYLRIVRDAVPDVFDADYTFTPGAVYRLREGTDVAMVSTGPQVSRVLVAADPRPRRHRRGAFGHGRSRRPRSGGPHCNRPVAAHRTHRHQRHLG
jgi:transketolase